MFNAHGRHVPAGAPPGSRFNEILEQLRVEYDAQISRGSDYEQKGRQAPNEMPYICANS